MMEELERPHIDRNSPIWGGSDCDYFSLEAEVNSYWTQYYKIKLNLTDELLYQTPTEKEEIEEHNRLIQALEDGVFDNTELKTEEYFRELWRDVSKVGFDLENSNHCIDTCKTLIREEVEWWEQREDLKEYRALKVPSLVEYHSWDVIWKLCKYHKLVAHPLYNHASKRQSVLKKNLPKNAPRIALKLNLNLEQLADLYQGLKDLKVFAAKHQDGQFLRAVNGSEHTSIIEPMKFKDNKVLSLVIMFLRDNLFIDGDPQYIKWQLFFGINHGRARRLVSDYGKLVKYGRDAQTHRTLPVEYDKIKNLFESVLKRG
jgi:hypothetical protein